MKDDLKEDFSEEVAEKERGRAEGREALCQCLRARGLLQQVMNQSEGVERARGGLHGEKG